MCGIGAVLDSVGTTSADVGEAMAAALAHRGPDGKGVRRIGPALLVHTRLAIIDVDGGDQPLSSEDGACTAIVNGEIYNHLDLRAELEARGHRFATRSDSEVVVHGYEEWGIDFVRRLNGMFGLVIWDAHRRRLFAARDPFGIKPLYWSRDGGRLVVASEIGALRATHTGPAEIDPVALDHYLAWRFVPAPRTLFAGVSKLAPAEMLIGEDGQVRIASYREAPGEPFDGARPDELADELEGRLVDAVERQMMADVPYGAFLSGGIDSAVIASAMGRRSDRAPRTFTVGFPGAGPTFDERGHATHTAAALGTDHRDVAMGEGDFATELADCVRRLEEPCGTASAPALLQLSRFTARSVKVVLSGQGADEPLGGYQRHQAAAALQFVDRVPRLLGRPAGVAAAALPRNERAKRAAGLLLAPAGLDRLLRVFEITAPELRRELTGDAGEQAAEERRRLASGVLGDVAGRDVLEQMLYLDTHLFLPDGLLVYGDKMSMAASLEQRVPFLDVELMRFVERIPARLRVRRLQRKWLYRRAVRDLVPAEALSRPKHPFATPYDDWLRASLGAEVERRYRPGGELGGLIQPSAATRLVAEHRAGRADHKRVLYCLLELSEWHSAFIEGRTAPAAAVA